MKARTKKHTRKDKDHKALQAKWFATYKPNTPVHTAPAHINNIFRGVSQ